MTETPQTKRRVRSVDQRLAEIKQRVARIEHSQTQAGQKKLARSRILVGLAALEAAHDDPDLAAKLAQAIRAFCTRSRDQASVTEVLEALDAAAARKRRGFFR